MQRILFTSRVSFCCIIESTNPQNLPSFALLCCAGEWLVAAIIWIQCGGAAGAPEAAVQLQRKAAASAREAEAEAEAPAEKEKGEGEGRGVEAEAGALDV